jgi:phospholipid/cholesterol/gamma-HCH transport system substrate-binding protein
MQEKKMKLLVGFFMISIFVIFSAFIYLLLKEKGTFEKHYTYHFTTDSAEYFTIGTPIKFSGFEIGMVDDISLKDDGSVEMSFTVRKENIKWLSEGSVLMIIKPLLGAPHIELFTSLGSPPLAEGSYLTMMTSDSINDLVVKLQPLMQKSIDILNNVHAMTVYLSSEDSELKKILQNLEKLTSKLANDDSLLTSMTGDKKATQEIIKSINETAKIMQDLSEITSSLKQDVMTPASSSIKEINSILIDIKEKLKTIDPTVKAIGTFDNELIEIKDQVSVGLQKSNQIMDKVDTILEDKTQSEVVLP